MKKCSVCEEDKTEDQFYKRQSRCIDCHKDYTRNHYLNNKAAYKAKAKNNGATYYARNRQWLQDYLSTHPCESCGNDDREVLEFDHLDRTLKDDDVSRLLGGSLDRLKAEVAKCRVLCANCHRKHTRRQMGHWYDAKVEFGTAYATASMPDPVVSVYNDQVI